MAEVTITVPDECGDVGTDAVRSAQRDMIWNALHETADQLAGSLEEHGPNELRPVELRDTLARFQRLVDEWEKVN